jgi:hypothetical protein
VRQIDLVLVPPRPARKSEVSNRNLAADEFGFAEPFVEHAIRTPGFVRATLDAVAAVDRVLHCQEVAQLVGHRAKTARLPHQPLQHRHPCGEVALGPKLADFLADRSGLHRIQTRWSRNQRQKFGGVVCWPKLVVQLAKLLTGVKPDPLSFLERLQPPEIVREMENPKLEAIWAAWSSIEPDHLLSLPNSGSFVSGTRSM